MRILVPLLVVAAALFALTASNQAQTTTRSKTAPTGEIEAIREQIAALEKRLASLEAKSNPRNASQNMPPSRVGHVYVVGNEKTPDEVIRAFIPLRPGEPLIFPEWRIGQKRLSTAGVVVVEPKTGAQATVVVVEGAGEFKDVIVTVKEK